MIGQLYVDGLGPGTRFLVETSRLDCRIEFPLADGNIAVEEMQLGRSVDRALSQSNSTTIPAGTVDGLVKFTVSMPPSARGLTVNPVAFGKPPAELRAVRRASQVAAPSQVPSRAPLAVDAVEAATSLAWHGGGRTLAFSPDRSRRATSNGKEQTVEIRNEESGEVQFALSGHFPRATGYLAIVHDVAFSPDGKRLASASADGAAKLWDAVTGKELLTFRRPVRYVHFARCLAFSPNGERLAVAYDDGFIKLWNVESGEESLTAKVKSQFVERLAFSPDGTRLGLADAQPNQTVSVWDVTSDNLQ